MGNRDKAVIPAYLHQLFCSVRHPERVTLLRSENEAAKTTEQGHQALENGLVRSELLEQLQERHAQEIEELKVGNLQTNRA